VRSQCSQLDSSYKPPPGFDTRNFKTYHGKRAALETVAGGKLHVVVEDERVCEDKKRV
jgi:hypothetical protein